MVQRATVDLPSATVELERYREHNNQPDNQDYRAYLQRFIDSAILPYVGDPRVEPPGGGESSPGGPPSRREPPHILDFGSGPHPVLTALLREAGYRVAPYDPFFLPNEDALSSATPMYDAVVMLEVIEHLHQPAKELDRLLALMKPGAVLILRTGVFDARNPEDDFGIEARAEAGSRAGAGAGADVASSGKPGGRQEPAAGESGAAPGPIVYRPAAPDSAAERFLAWWYRRDPTHVLFLTPATIAWMEARFSLRLIHRAKGDELAFQRKDNT